MLLAVFETAIAKMRVFRVPEFLGAALMLGLLGDAAAASCRGASDERHLAFDVAHLLAGGLVLVSFMLLYQDRLYALLNIFALHALVLALSVAWQAYIQDAPHLYVTAAIALVFKASSFRSRCTGSSSSSASIARSKPSVGIGLTMLAGMALVALSMVVMLSVTGAAAAPRRGPMRRVWIRPARRPKAPARTHAAQRR